MAIVYNDSGDTYAMETVKGHFFYAHIIVNFYLGLAYIYPF